MIVNIRLQKKKPPVVTVAERMLWQISFLVTEPHCQSYPIRQANSFGGDGDSMADVNQNGNGAGQDAGRMLTVKETAEMLRVSVNTIYQYAWRGDLPKYRAFPRGGRVYFKISDVKAFMMRYNGGADHEQ